jgi:hypothetical protein
MKLISSLTVDTGSIGTIIVCDDQIIFINTYSITTVNMNEYNHMDSSSSGHFFCCEPLK